MALQFDWNDPQDFANPKPVEYEEDKCEWNLQFPNPGSQTSAVCGNNYSKK